MGKLAISLALLKVVMFLICITWISVWILKPTNLWTRKWKEVEDTVRNTVLGYYGLDFAVYTFPIISVAIIGLVYLNFKAKEVPRRSSRQTKRWRSAFSNPLVVNSFLRVLSMMEILAALLFIIFLAWTFYERISNDFKKLDPLKGMKLDLWQLKYLRVATRFGLLAEACLALLLLPILRGLAVFQILGIQFEVSVKYHMWLGTAMMFFASFHGASTLIIWAVSHNIQDEIWKWQKTGRIYLAGEISLVVGMLIWITSLPQIRRNKFEFFYSMHHLYIIFLVFFLFHAGDRHFYMVFPGIFIFGLDKLLRIIQSRTESCLLSARLFPCKALQLTLPKDTGLNYTPTSIIFMKIPSISKFQWHSFSIISSSTVEDSTMSVIIKCQGTWTNALHDMVKDHLDVNVDKKINSLPVAIEGPYGPTSTDFLRYDSLLLIAGGIGVTPFLSILQEIASSKRHGLPTRIQLIHVVKNSQDISLLSTISPLLVQNKMSKKWHLNVKVFVTQESRSDGTLGQVLELLPQEKTIHFASGSHMRVIHGQESYLWRAVFLGIASIAFFVLLLWFNHVFLPSKGEKKLSASAKLAVSSEKKAVKEKNPSWISDLLIIASFILALMCSSIMAIVLRWKRMKKETPFVPKKLEEVEMKDLIDEAHQVYYGRRPNLKDIFFEFSDVAGGSSMGVLVCGPEGLKEAVAELCRKRSPCLKMLANKKEPVFNYHCLNFTL